MQWMPLWETDGMKVMPFLSVMKYGWHYSNACIGMLRLLRSELFLYPLKGFRLKMSVYACGLTSTGITSIGFCRTKSTRIHTAAGCGLFPGDTPEYPVIYEGGLNIER